MKTENDKHLDLLAIFHYIVGGITALFYSITHIHVAIGIAMLLGKFGGPNPPPAFLGWIFIGIGGSIILMGWALAACMIIAGRKLHKRKARMYCIVVGALECFMMPFGTILGVFTIIVLSKEGVKEMFSANKAVEGMAPR